MQQIISILVVLTTPLLLAADTDDDVWKELKPFPKDQIPAFTIVMAANDKSTGQTPQGDFGFTITINPKKNPKTIDNLHDSGDQKGKKEYGIYKLEGDKFTVCMTPAGSAEGDRPKDFTTNDTTNVVFVFERVKEDKKP